MQFFSAPLTLFEYAIAEGHAVLSVCLSVRYLSVTLVSHAYAVYGIEIHFTP